MRFRRRTLGIPERRWHSPRSPMCSGSASCDSTRRNPIWPNRDRFVLSNGHASMLLYSLLHLAGVRGRRSGLRGGRRGGRGPRGHKALPPSSTPSAQDTPEYRWTLRPSRPPPGRSGQGIATSVGDGGPRQSGSPRATTPPASSCSTFDVYTFLRRRRLRGGRLQRGGLPRGTPAARQPLLGLRQTTTSRSTAIPRSPTRDDVAARFAGYGLECHPGRGPPMTSISSPAASRPSAGRKVARP